MKQVLSFLSELVENNNKIWFDAHKQDYLKAQATFNRIAAEIIEGVGQFDPSVRGLRLKDCTYRFYRDIRFSKDKSPYKNHFGVFVAQGGKCSGHSGYYFHIEPNGANYLQHSLLCCGAYAPEPIVLKSIREEFMLNGDGLAESIKEAEGFELDRSYALKNIPKGFPADSQYAEYFKLKNVLLNKYIDEDYIFSENLVKNVVADFRLCYKFNTIINAAVDFAYREMT